MQNRTNRPYRIDIASADHTGMEYRVTYHGEVAEVTSFDSGLDMARSLVASGEAQAADVEHLEDGLQGRGWYRVAGVSE